MDKLNMETPNLTDKNIEKILELFPNVATEKEDENGKLKIAVDFDKLKQELSDNIVDGEESYDFTWVGKREAMVEANRPIRKTLRPDRASSVNWDTTKNLYIEGDNLDALKLLQESYLGQVKMIYIDPPYNTGNDFVYRDNFTQDKESYEEDLGAIDEEGNRLFQNTEANGRFHSDWCSMIYPRLKLARNLLTEDGVIFISIDDNEINNLKKICDEVFGADNYESDFYIKVRHENRILREDIRYQLVIEHALCYRKSIYNPSRREKSKNSNDDYIYDLEILNPPKQTIKMGAYNVEIYNKNDYQILKKESGEGSLKEYQIRGSLISQSGSASEYYELNLRDRKNIDGEGALYKVIGMGTKGDGLGYRFIRQPNDFSFKNGFYYQGKPLANTQTKGLPYANFYDYTNETNKVGYEGDIDFKNGKKPIALLDKFFEIANIYNEKDAIILDFFSGSSSTAHACMQLNSLDNGHRKFIMIQIPENNGIKDYDNICKLAQQRIKNVGKKIQEENPDKKIDIGFRVLKVDDTNMKDVYYTPQETDQKTLGTLVSNIKDDRTDEDLLYGVLLDWGVELSLPHKIEAIDGKRVHIVNNDDLVACFESSISETVIRKIAEKKPTRVVFRDGSFNTDDHKINVEEIFKLLAPDTTVKVI